MAVRVTKDLICDICGGDEGVSRYRFTRVRDDRKITADLCAEHAGIIEELFKLMPAGKRGQTRARPVLTEAEIVAKRKPRK